MNYERIYNAIINKAKNMNRYKNDECYYELHHIVPKCLGGLDETNNVILLTAKEHYICHRLLVEMYPDNIKLKYAFDAMRLKRSSGNRVYKYSARFYERIKQELRKDKSIRLKINNPMYNEELKKRRSVDMTANNLYHRLNDASKLKHKVNTSLSKQGGKNPNAKRCVWTLTGEVFESGTMLLRTLQLRKNIGYYIKHNLAQWL